MPVLLHCTRTLPPREAYEQWAVIGDTPAGLDPKARVPGLGVLLELMMAIPAVYYLKQKMVLKSAGLYNFPQDILQH